MGEAAVSYTHLCLKACRINLISLLSITFLSFPFPFSCTSSNFCASCRSIQLPFTFFFTSIFHDPRNGSSPSFRSFTFHFRKVRYSKQELLKNPSYFPNPYEYVITLSLLYDNTTIIYYYITTIIIYYLLLLLLLYDYYITCRVRSMLR